MEDLTRLCADTFIWVGSCGAIQPEMNISELVITTGGLRQEGTSKEYIRETCPARADYEAVCALVAAAERVVYDYHTGVTMSTDSFYTRQGRPGFEGFETAGSNELIEQLQAINVANIEMEASALLTIASIYGLRAGAVCSVYGNRATGEFWTEGEPQVAETASLATHFLAKMDVGKQEANLDWWHTGLTLE